ncbi:MAG: hypothetical protein GF353_03370, partial [Candidatus Lokiarchaeota archaeon]|nr:hypothetical protein [Candidatus Lokiarchaeota archaeon]
MKRLVIPARLHLQNQQANLIQTLQMAEAFQKNIETLLVSDKAREDYYPGSKKFKDIVSEYNIDRNLEYCQFNNFLNFIPGTYRLRKKIAAKKIVKLNQKLNIDFCFTRVEEIAYHTCIYLPTVLE